MTARRVVRNLGLGLSSRGGGTGVVGLLSLCRRCISNITHPTLDYQKAAESWSSPPRQRSSFPIRVVPRPDIGTGSEKDKKPDYDDCYHYFHLADYEQDEQEEKPLPWPKVRRIMKKKILGSFNYGLAQCVGSSHGWLAFMDDPNPSINTYITLVNTLDDHYSTEQKPNCFDLPPIPMESISDGSVQKAQFSIPSVPFIQKVALSSPPYEDTCIMAAAIHGGPRCNLAFYNHNDEKVEATWWIPGGGGGDYSDVVYSKNDGIFYAIRNPQPNDKVTDYPIEAWDPCSHRFTLIHPSFHDPNPHVLERSSFGDGELDEKRYLVESCRAGGDLYLVCRYIAKIVDEDQLWWAKAFYDELDPSIVPCYRTLFFKAYKLNRIDMCWIPVHDWERQAFFVGKNHSFSFPLVDPPHKWPDCIYFSDDYFGKMHISPFLGGHDNGVCGGCDTSPIYYEFMMYKFDQHPPVWLDDLSPLP